MANYKLTQTGEEVQRILNSVQTIDNSVTQNSSHPVSGGAVFSYLNSALSNTVAESGVYDVTVNNNNAKFASLSALLNSENLDTLIPIARRKGGMSIKFVHTYDNKYVQARLMADSFTADATKWQVVDNKPTDGSKNLVESGGVAESINDVRDLIYTDSPNILNPAECTENADVAWITGQGFDINTLTERNGFCISGIIDVKAGEKYIFNFAYHTSIYYYPYPNAGQTKANDFPANSAITIPTGVTKMRYIFPINANPNWRNTVMLVKGETLPQSFKKYGIRYYNFLTPEEYNELNESNVQKEELLVKNVLNPNGCSKNKVPSSVGNSIETEVTGNGYVCSNLISVKPGETYIFTSQGYNNNIWFANGDKMVIQKTTKTANTPFVIPDGVYYMRYAFTYPSDFDDRWKEYVMLLKGCIVPSRYIPYNQNFISDDIKFNKKSTEGVGPDKARIILNFDAMESDGSIFSYRKPILDEYGFKGVACINNAYFNNNFSEWKNDNLKQEFYDLLKDGYDFGLYTSIRADERTAEEWASIIPTIVANLESVNVNNIVGYHCTGNNLTEGLYNALKANNFHIVRCTLGQYSAGDSEYYMKGESDDSLITLVTSTPNNSKTATSILNQIDQAIRYKAYLPIMFHRIRDVSTSEEIEDYNTYLSVFRAILDYIKQKEVDGELEVVTWRQMYNQLNPSVGYENDYNRLLKNSFYIAPSV